MNGEDEDIGSVKESSALTQDFHIKDFIDTLNMRNIVYKALHSLTSDEFSYWYANANNEGIYDSVEAKDSKIVFISDEEKPYLKIISYSTYRRKINHNNGRENVRTEEEWNEYIFYLPKEIMQYELN